MLKNCLFFSKIRGVFTFSLLFFFIVNLNAQVGINTDSPKVTLDVNLGNINNVNPDIPPGFIAPVLTLEQLNSITKNYSILQKGTIIYVSAINVSENLDESVNQVTTEGYYYFDGFNWNQFITPSSGEIPTEPWISSLDGEGATSNSDKISHSSQVGIGMNSFINPIDENAQLEISSTSKGLLIPRLTKAQRDAITTPTVSLLIWNTDEKCFNFYKDDVVKWRSLCGDLGDAEIQINDCSSISITGSYTVGVPLESNTNTLILTVNVTKPGNYSIAGTTTVGIFFQKSGVFPTTGVYTIIIPGYGAPTSSGSDIPVVISINDYKNTTCNAITIGKIEVTNLNYSINSVVTSGTDKLIIGESTNGKKIQLNINVQEEGIYTIETNEDPNTGIKYGVYTTKLLVGNQVVSLYSNGVIMPKYKPDGTKYTATDNLNFTLTGTGQSNNFTVDVGLISQDASFTVTSITPNTNNNNYFVSGKAANANNFIDVVLNFSTVGNYSFKAFDADANVEYLLEGKYTGNLNSNQRFRIYATTTIIPNKVGDYIYKAYLNDIVSTSTFNVSVVYPKPKIVIYGWGFTNNMKNALANIANFGPQGTFKVERMTAGTKSYANDINQFGGEQFTYANLDDAINNQNVKIILITWDVYNTKAVITPEIITLLSKFITDKKGYVFFTNATNQGPFVKQLLDKSHGTALEVVANDSYPLKAAVLPSSSANTTANSYLNGKFGSLLDKYYVVYDQRVNNYSWVGFNPTTLVSSTSGLYSLVNLPSITYNAVSYPAAESLIYSTKFGFMMLPDLLSLVNVNNDTGLNNPIGFNTNQGSNNIRILGNNGNLLANGSAPILVGKAGDWVLFGNIMAQAIKYTFENYKSTVQISGYTN